MAYRFYLTNSTTPYTPPTIRGAWDLTTSAIVKYLGPDPGGVAATRGQAETSTNTAYDVLFGRWVSDGIPKSGDLAGTIDWAIGLLESISTAAHYLHMHAYVTVGTSDTVRGTLLTDRTSSVQIPTTATGQSANGPMSGGAATDFVPVAINTVSVQAGDRIVIEIGYQAQNSVSTSRTSTMNYGNTGNFDLLAQGTNVTAAPGWVQFSDPNGVLKDNSFSSRNLCHNPCASVSTDNWANGNANTSLARSTSITGMSRTTGINFTVSAASVICVTPTAPASAGEVWAIYLEVACTATRSATIYFNPRNARGGFLALNPSQSVTLGPTPQIIKFSSQTMGTATSTVDISIEGSGFSSGDIITVSCVRFAALDIDVYADGDSTDWAWDGTTGLSTSHRAVPAPPPGAFLPFFV